MGLLETLPTYDNSPCYFYMTKREQEHWKRAGVIPGNAKFDINYGGLIMKEVKPLRVNNGR